MGKQVLTIIKEETARRKEGNAMGEGMGFFTLDLLHVGEDTNMGEESMKRNLLITSLLLFISVASFSQDVLDVEKNKDAELFVIKKDYDIQERLKEIGEIVGKEVTVYEVSGKKNTIKLTYTGIAEMANYPNITDKSKATLITVKVNEENGTMKAYFPLTNDTRYRIYLKEKLK